MLVLTRKTREKLIIGDEIVLTVLEVQGNRVRLGIDAPPDIRIIRSELQVAIPTSIVTAEPDVVHP
jgi:carbon storage regulator